MYFFPELGRCGRLGNQMFQLAALKTLALKNKLQIYLPEDIYTRVADGQSCLLYNFKHTIPFINPLECIHLNLFTEAENHLTVVDRRFFDISGSMAVQGYFESEQFFKEYKEEIKSMYTFVDSINAFSREYIESIKQIYPTKEIVGIHFRRGDYRESHDTPGLFLQYIDYARNIQFNDDKYIFLLFTGGNQQKGNSNELDMNWCKQHIPNTLFCEVNDTIKDLAIMTKCDHMILTTKSTLGWWGAYLNKNPQKKIVVPGISIGPTFNPDLIWPTEFIKIM
jgi:hypothetical protein